MKNVKATKNTPAKKSVSLEKNAIVASEKAPKAKTEKVAAEPKPKVGKYGAPAQRPNRVEHTASEFGNRKWIYRGVTVFNDKTKEVTTDATQCQAFEKSRAEEILAILLQRPDVANGRLFFKKSENPDIAMRSVWIAFKAENGVVDKAA